MNNRNSIISGLAILACLFVTAPAWADEPADGAGSQPSNASYTLAHDAQCERMKDQFIELAALQAVENWYWQFHARHYRPSDVTLDADGGAFEDAPASAPSMTRAQSTSSASKGGAASSSGPTNYTKTNNQERGVDEADIVKTDGKYIYTLTGDEIVIVKSWPANEARVLSRLKIGGTARPTNLFLNGDKLVAISYLSHATQIGRGSDQRSWYGATRVSVIDVRNRANPYVVRHVDVEGYTNQARMIGHDIYVVTNSGVQPPAKIWELSQNYSNWPEAEPSETVDSVKRRAYAGVRDYLAAELADVDFSLALPHKRVSSYRGKFSGRQFEPLTACNDIHVPRTGVQYGMVSLVHFDVRTPWKVDASSVFGSGWQVYGSQDAIYVAMPNYNWTHWYRWYSDQTPDYEEYNSTVIHKFDLSRDVGKPSYAASGRVRGYLHNQFSMSEYGGDLRVATTDQGWWWGRGQGEQRQQANHIYVLRPDGDQLATIGRVEGLAPGERIYAARMFGDKGYIVTFRQTDPLFTLDLSDPTSPEVVGELKINGFSSYIHPIGDDRLLTVGQDADDNGRVTGVHLQIFDVSDPSQPTRAHHHTFETSGYSWSTAQWDHKAFTYDSRTGTLALPMQFYPRNGVGEYFNGIYVFDVDAERGIRGRGRVSHGELVDSWRRRTCEKNPESYQCTNAQTHNRHYWGSWAHLTRSIIMDDTIFTLSNLGLMAHELEGPNRPVSERPLSIVELAQL